MRATPLAALPAFCAAALAFFAATNTQIAPQGRWAVFTRKLETEYPKDGPGVFAIAAEGDRILFSKGLGEASVELGVPLTQDSVVRIASLTKQFTSVAVLLLVQQRRLELEDRLARILSDCPGPWRDITVRELLSQTSGLTDDLSPLYARMTADMTVDQLLALYRDRPLDAQPGSKWHYSNLNYWILGKVVETVSGEPYAEFVMHHVLARGMNRTRYGSHDAIIIGRAQGYESAGKASWTNARYFSSTLGYAAGGFLSTPHDLAVWYAALASGTVISPSFVKLALTETHTTDGKPTGYGFAWYVADRAGERVAHHGGSTFGFESSIYWIPSRRLFAGIFKNSSDDRGEPDADARALLEAAQSQTPVRQIGTRTRL